MSDERESALMHAAWSECRQKIARGESPTHNTADMERVRARADAVCPPSDFRALAKRLAEAMAEMEQAFEEADIRNPSARARHEDALAAAKAAGLL